MHHITDNGITNAMLTENSKDLHLKLITTVTIDI